MAWARTFDEPVPQRVNKWLAQAGVCSRREAEALIAAGLVFVDGQRVNEPGFKIAQGQRLELRDGAQRQLDAQIAVMIHKPVGYVSAQPEAGQVPAARLLRAENLWGGGRAPGLTRRQLAPLGRLDQDSRGLLLLSDDGALAKALIGPESKLDKEYQVRVAGAVDARRLELLRHGLELDGRKLRPAQVTQTGKGALLFVLREGRKRQIRRMCELVGLEVTDLYRTRIGPVGLGELPEGRWRLLTAEERAALIGASR